nr:hypothetical protein [uncultured Chitinophaga sp.]
MIKAPVARYPTYEAIQALARAFNYPYDQHMQDWEYEVARFADIEKYFTTYETSDDDDIRFILMEMIIETSNEDRYFDWKGQVWPKVYSLLKKNFLLHAYTVYYWCDFDSERIEDSFSITPEMRGLWEEQSKEDYP